MTNDHPQSLLAGWWSLIRGGGGQSIFMAPHVTIEKFTGDRAFFSKCKRDGRTDREASWELVARIGGR